MTNVVLLGGNGYLGRNLTKHWLKADPDATFYVVSRSGKNKLTDPRTINVSADVTNSKQVAKYLLAKLDYIVDLVRRQKKILLNLKKSMIYQLKRCLL